MVWCHQKASPEAFGFQREAVKIADGGKLVTRQKSSHPVKLCVACFYSEIAHAAFRYLRLQASSLLRQAAITMEENSMNSWSSKRENTVLHKASANVAHMSRVRLQSLWISPCAPFGSLCSCINVKCGRRWKKERPSILHFKKDPFGISVVDLSLSFVYFFRVLPLNYVTCLGYIFSKGIGVRFG